MKTVERKIYVSFDGVEFTAAADCRAHEREHAPERLVGLTADQVDAAITRDDPDLADAIERVGTLITARRIGRR